MPVLDKVGGDILRRSIVAGAVWVGRERQKIDALNVFPVPDGDTGTNMYLTLLGAARTVARRRGASVEKVASDAAMGALLGARGNSGVILSQFFHGFSEALKGCSMLGVRELATAMAEGYRCAHAAVGRPVEGTILTVMRRAAAAARLAVNRGDDMETVLSIILAETRLAVSETPEQLPVLRDAGVVDAGGQGFLSFLEGVWSFIMQKKLGRGLLSAIRTGRSTTETLPASVEHRYCTEFVMINSAVDAEEARTALEPLGSSLLAVGEESLLKVHIHTDDPGAVLAWATSEGELEGIKIDNMLNQTLKRLSNEKERTPDSPEKQVLGSGVVAVASGHGLEELLSALGAGIVICGGQTMNPSVEELLQAVEELPQTEIIILPNNGNIVMAARRLSALTQKRVRVVPSKDPAQGIAAMLHFDSSLDVEKNLEAMSEVLEHIASGEITKAVRGVTLDGIKIRKGDYIGLISGKIVVAGRSPDNVLPRLLENMAAGWGLATIYYGEDIDATRAEKTAQAVRERFPEAEVEVVEGGQPHYHYLIAVE